MNLKEGKAMKLVVAILLGVAAVACSERPVVVKPDPSAPVVYEDPCPRPDGLPCN